MDCSTPDFLVFHYHRNRSKARVPALFNPFLFNPVLEFRLQQYVEGCISLCISLLGNLNILALHCEREKPNTEKLISWIQLRPLGFRFDPFVCLPVCLVKGTVKSGLPRWLSGNEPTCILYLLRDKECRRHGLDPWVRKIPWRTWQPTPVSLLGSPMERRTWRVTVYGVVKQLDRT